MTSIQLLAQQHLGLSLSDSQVLSFNKYSEQLIEWNKKYNLTAIKDSKTVISDRYSDSRYAYQGATLQGPVKKPVEWVMGLHKGWTLEPDYTILLDIDPKISVTRVNSRAHQTKFEKISFLEQVRNNYFKLVDMEPGRFRVIDAQQPLEKVEEEVLQAVKEKMK